MALKFVLGAFALATFSVIYITANQDVLDWPVILGSDAWLYCVPERSAEKHGKTDWVEEAGWHMYIERKEADGTWTYIAGAERSNSTSEWRVKVAAGSRYKMFGHGFLGIQNVSKADNNTVYKCTILGSDSYMEPFELKLYVMEAKAVQVDGNWSPWNYWSECSTSCGGGEQRRTRFCTNPPAAFGGKLCAGESGESRSCSSKHCPIDGNWSPWNYWSECSTSCGGGVQRRTRFCTNPPAAFGGKPCAGESVESRSCSSKHCPIDGNWSPWYYWSECSTSCGGGEQRRTRFCTNPPAAFGGKPCAGESGESRSCSSKHCPEKDWGLQWKIMAYLFFLIVAIIIVISFCLKRKGNTTMGQSVCLSGFRRIEEGHY